MSQVVVTCRCHARCRWQGAQNRSVTEVANEPRNHRQSIDLVKCVRLRGCMIPIGHIYVTEVAPSISTTLSAAGRPFQRAPGLWQPLIPQGGGAISDQNLPILAYF